MEKYKKDFFEKKKDKISMSGCEDKDFFNWKFEHLNMIDI